MIVRDRRSAARRTIRRFLVLPLVFAAARPHVAGAQVIANTERKLLPMQQTTLATLPKDFWSGLAFLRDQEAKESALKADISFGLSGDESGPRSLYKLSTGISLSRGVFPSEISVVSKLGLQLVNGVLQEDVTTLRITYDYHPTKDAEYFTFAERFSDNFLSIQQRYEIGFGGRLSLELGRTGGWRAAAQQFDAVDRVLEPMRATSATEASTQPLNTGDLRSFQGATQNLTEALRSQDARLLVGLAASVFAEIERASLDVVSVPGAGATTSADSIKSSVIVTQERYRLSIRPTVRWRPTSDITVTLFPYFKLPLDQPRRVLDSDGHNRLDYRRDILSELTWSLKTDQTGLENVDFVLIFNDFYDNVPPSLPASLIAAQSAINRHFTFVQAQRDHRVLSLALRLRW